MEKFLKQNYLKYGLLMTVPLLLCLLYMEVTSQNQSFDQKSPLIIILMMIAPFIVSWLGIAAKKKLQKSKLTFKQGFVEGFKISLVYGIVSSLLFLLYYTLINPAILAYARTVYNMIDSTNAMVIFVDLSIQLVASVIFGSIYAAIISFFIKSK